jgi:hypothetical protein
MEQEVKREITKLQKQIKALVAIKDKSTWVSAHWVTDLTGWDKERLRTARDQNIIEHKRSEGGGWLYKLESIPQQFIKQKQPS